MTYKSILSLAIAAAFMGTAGLSSPVLADHVDGDGALLAHYFNRGGHDMTFKDEIDEGEVGYARANVAYDNGGGNGGEDAAGNYVEDEVEDYDPVDADD